MNEYKIVRVKWRDAEALNGWQKQDDIDEFVKKPNSVMESVGWLIHKNDDYIVIAQTCGEYAVCELTKIPMGCVIDELQDTTASDDERN